MSSEKLPYSYKIENVVATVKVEVFTEDKKLDLNLIAKTYPDVEYYPERFSGLIMRFFEPKGTMLVFASGNFVLTGLRDAKFAKPVVELLMKKLRDTGFDFSEPEIIIQNIVASGSMNLMVDLNMAAVVMENAMYEPEVFPGLIYRMQDPYSVCLIFSTGKVVCTATKNKEMLGKAMANLYHDIKTSGVVMDNIQDSGAIMDDDDQLFL